MDQAGVKSEGSRDPYLPGLGKALSAHWSPQTQTCPWGWGGGRRERTTFGKIAKRCMDLPLQMEKVDKAQGSSGFRGGEPARNFDGPNRVGWASFLKEKRVKPCLQR